MTRTLQVLILLRTDPASRPVLCYTEPAPVRSVPLQNSSVEICFSTELARCDQSCTEPAGPGQRNTIPRSPSPDTLSPMVLSQVPAAHAANLFQSRPPTNAPRARFRCLSCIGLTHFLEAATNA